MALNKICACARELAACVVTMLEQAMPHHFVVHELQVLAMQYNYKMIMGAESRKLIMTVYTKPQAW